MNDVKNWQSISSNPDDRRVLEFRRLRVTESHKPPVRMLAEFLKVNLTGKSVLDFGYANHSSDTPSIATESTHSYVVEFATSVLAVDIVKTEFENSEKREYLTGNLLTDVTFRTKVLDSRVIDTLFVGGTLEHLENPSLILDLFRDMSERCGTKELLVTVPNYLWLICIYDLISLRTNDLSLNVDHVNTFYPGSLIEIAERNGCKVTEWSYVGKDDMVKLFAPRPRRTQLIWAGSYWLVRKLNLPFAFNLLTAKIELSEDE
jgi:hypothetical protein